MRDAYTEPEMFRFVRAASDNGAARERGQRIVPIGSYAQPRRSPAPWYALLLGAAFLLVQPQPAAAQALQSPCDSVITHAESAYVSGDFDLAISLLSTCLAEGPGPEEITARAYRLLILGFLRKQDLDSARLTVLELLRLAPEYEPDPVRDPPAYVALVELVRSQITLPDTALQAAAPDTVAIPAVPPVPERPGWLRRKRGWLLAGGSVFVAGMLGLLLSGGGGGGGGTVEPPPGRPPLPLPPAFP